MRAWGFLMSGRLLRRFGAGVLAGALGVAVAPGASQAIPGDLTPTQPGYIPGGISSLVYPGSYQYFYNLIPVSGPATTDARGIRAVASVDPASEANGLPGSQLGLTANKSSPLGNNASMRYHISAGLSPAPSVQPGLSIAAGDDVPTVEDLGGAPPKTAPGAESAQSTTVPAVPGNSQIVEDPGGAAPGSSSSTPQAESSQPSGPVAPPAVQVFPGTSGFSTLAPGTGSGPGISASVGSGG